MLKHLPAFDEAWKKVLEMERADEMQHHSGLSKKQRAYWTQKKKALDHYFTPASKRIVIERDRAIWNAANEAIKAGAQTWEDVHKQLAEQGKYQRFNVKTGKWRTLPDLEGWRILRRLFKLPPDKPGRPKKKG